MSAGSFTAFMLASLVLAATPGPGVLFIVSRTLTQGRRAGLASVAGVALGNLGNALGASLGLAALLSVSALAFSVVRYAGAAYLLWLGLQALRDATRPAPAEASAASPVSSQPRRILRDGALVALLNPKTAIFFAAFLPQFMDPSLPAMTQTVALGACFVAIAACTDSAYVLAAHATARSLLRNRHTARLGPILSAAVFLGLGLWTALSDQRARI